ncbi:MAG: efflux RND transporter periplasmic adaptor subunit [Saprospiraceae bacterium]
MEYQKALIRKTEILAPFDGILGLRNVSIGAHIAPGTVLTTIRSKDKMKLDFSVPEKYADEIKKGMNVDFKLTNDMTTYSAKVIATEMGINENTRNYKVRAIVNQKSDKLISGSFANVNLDLGEKSDAIMIPSQSIIPSARNKTVIIANNGKAEFKPVITGIRKSDLVEVTEGLELGDTIVTSGLLFLKDANPIKFSQVKVQ